MTNKELIELVGKEVKFFRPPIPTEKGFFVGDADNATAPNPIKDIGTVRQVNIEIQVSQHKGNKQRKQYASISVYSKKLKKICTIEPGQLR